MHPLCGQADAWQEPQMPWAKHAQFLLPNSSLRPGVPPLGRMEKRSQADASVSPLIFLWEVRWKFPLLGVGTHKVKVSVLVLKETKCMELKGWRVQMVGDQEIIQRGGSTWDRLKRRIEIRLDERTGLPMKSLVESPKERARKIPKHQRGPRWYSSDFSMM